MNKVLFYHDAFPFGGAERITLDIANYVYNKGYEVYVLTPKLHVASFKHLKAIEIVPKSSKNKKAYINHIIKFINDYQIDIFVGQSLDLLLYQSIKEQTQCKVIRALHNVPMWESIDRYYRRKGKSRFSIWEFIRYTFTYINYYFLKSYNKKYITRYKAMYDNIDALTVLCDAYKKQLATYFKDDKRIHVITNPEYPRSNPNLNKKKQIIYSGRLSYPHKRVDRLLSIWKKIYKEIPEWELIIIGDGPERNILELLAKKWKLERIKFIGYIPDVDIYYRNASILCLTSTF